jgi:hypothetical protein
MLGLSTAFLELKKNVRRKAAAREIERRFADRDSSISLAHGLGKPLVLSLTSYPARYPTLALTLKSALSQTMPADTVILWVSEKDHASLPGNVLELRNRGLEIAICADLRSYNKIIPTLQNHPGCFVVTIDDDVYYDNRLIETLVASHDPQNHQILCHRAHEITLKSDGLPKPYETWKMGIRQVAVSPLIFPTGVMGVLYPPDVFHEDVCNSGLFTQLSPTADDVWLYWMWRLNGHCGRQVGAKKRVIGWPGTQDAPLKQVNVEQNGNDRSIQNLIGRYGFPK